MKDTIDLIEPITRDAEEPSLERVDELNQLAWEIRRSDGGKARELSQTALEIAKTLGYERGIAYAKRNLGTLHFFHSDVEKSMAYLLDALEWFEQKGDIEGEATVRSVLGIAYWGFGDFQRGFDCTFRALKLYEAIDDANGLAWTYGTLGSFYFDFKDYRLSLRNFRRAWSLFKKLRNKVGEARALNGIGNAYHAQGNSEQALKYQRKSLCLHQTAKNLLGESRTLNDIGLIYQDTGNYSEALTYHLQSLELRRQVEYHPGIISTLIDLGTLYLNQGNYREAQKNLREALELAEKTNAKPKMGKAHYLLAQVFKAMKKYQLAFEHFEKFHVIDEMVYHEDVDQKVHNLQSAYHVERSQKEAEIYRLKNVELKAKNEQLQDTLNQLNAAQAQLIQAGKMAALGNLVASVVHEINTPVGTISSAADISNRAISKILENVQNVTVHTSPDAEFKKMLQILQQTNETILTAGSRISKICQSLQTFSRLDEAEYKKVDIHEGIDSALTLLSHQLDDRITVKKRYGKLPKIYCYPNELNQMFMNLLINAAQAIQGRGSITITTKLEKNSVIITITDTGKGIPPEKIDNLFDPGFTHRNSRVRMRTGLYTTFTIVQKHDGDIRVQSRVGKGTTFTIRLPLKQ